MFVGSVRPVYGMAVIGSCLGQFQICVCVSGLVRLLSASKFSLRQSASTVTKSLSSPAGASCQSKEKREQLRVRILNNHENPALRHNRYFNIATAQRTHEAMHVAIRINKICSCDTAADVFSFILICNSLCRRCISSTLVCNSPFRRMFSSVMLCNFSCCWKFSGVLSVLTAVFSFILICNSLCRRWISSSLIRISTLSLVFSSFLLCNCSCKRRFSAMWHHRFRWRVHAAYSQCTVIGVSDATSYGLRRHKSM